MIETDRKGGSKMKERVELNEEEQSMLEDYCIATMGGFYNASDKTDGFNFQTNSDGWVWVKGYEDDDILCWHFDNISESLEAAENY